MITFTVDFKIKMIEFIKAEPSDVKDLISVQNQAFYSDYKKYGECPGYNRSCESMLALITEKHTYKIVKDGYLIGDFIVIEKENEDYFLGSLCVIPDHQNTGIGTTAMKYMDNLFSNAKHWSLETPEENVGSIRFYNKMGFSITKRYLDGNVKIVLLEKFNL